MSRSNGHSTPPIAIKLLSNETLLFTLHLHLRAILRGERRVATYLRIASCFSPSPKEMTCC